MPEANYGLLADPAKKAAARLIAGFPRLAYPRYAAWLGGRYRGLGLKRGILALSFDNDYTQDNEAAEKLLPLLDAQKARVTWAVVGRWAEKYPQLHRDLVKSGHELMNHTWSHPDNSQLRPGDARKFSQISAEEAELEITRAHEFCASEFGYVMKGFRAPHFRYHPAAGAVLKKLGYKYTSCTSALASRDLGLFFRAPSGTIELPLAALPRKPRRIVESYRLFRAPDGLYKSEASFFADFRELLYFTARYGLVSCVYLDAADVVKLSAPAFPEYLAEAKRSGVELLTLGETADMALAALKDAA
jgi:peptidoglycan/xylan/chitin deacetylase (PgdA/CDA1 family)